MDYVFVAIFGSTPIATAHSMEDIEKMLDDYNGVDKGLSKRVRYQPYDSKFPSINDLEGTYYYKEIDFDYEDEFKVYCVGYRENLK